MVMRDGGVIGYGLMMHSGDSSGGENRDGV